LNLFQREDIGHYLGNWRPALISTPLLI
jgi:hypothetical protein